MTESNPMTIGRPINRWRMLKRNTGNWRSKCMKRPEEIKPASRSRRNLMRRNKQIWTLLVPIKTPILLRQMVAKRHSKGACWQIGNWKAVVEHHIKTMIGTFGSLDICVEEVPEV